MAGRKIKGRGDYNSSFNLRGLARKLDQTLSAIPKGTFARKGAKIGSKFGPLGALAGKGLGAGISAITGYGNYTVRKNSLSTMSTSVDMIPQFVKNEHSVRVVHREYIRDLAVPANGTAFNNSSAVINPANKEIFPWLSNMAKQYSQYKVHGMVFAFKTMSSDLALAGPLGTVIMATNYNAVDRDFASKIEMENSEFAVSTKPSQSLVHAIECDPKYSGMDILYIRDPAYETGETSDRRFYDYGKWQLATQGLPGAAGTTLGEIWVSYDIELLKPILGGATVTGTSLISKLDGSLGVGSGAAQPPRPLLIDYVGQDSATTPGFTYELGPIVVASTSGDTLLEGPVVSYSGGSGAANTVVLRKNGLYVVEYIHQYSTTATAITLVALNSIPGPPTLTATNTNRATNTVVPNIVDFPHAYPAGVTNRGLTFRFKVNVSGIVNASDFVTLLPSTWIMSTTNQVAFMRRSVRVTWQAFGYNDEISTFVQANA